MLRVLLTDIHQTRRHEDLLPCNKLQKSATTLSKTAIANGKNTTSGTGSVESTAETQRRLKLKQNLKVELCSRDLWRKFHSLGTEMIITKAGRRMFPTVKVRLTGLDPAASYIVFLDIIPVDDKRYRYVYHSSQWMVAGSGDPPLPHNLYVHPDSPATGQLWMAQGVVAFDKLKLTNNRKPLVRGQVSLHSMHKYLPRVHILQTTDLDTPPEQQARVERALTYTFPETTFTTVTAYQNQQITRLKIASNPFAKGFREASRTRDTLDDSGHTKPQEYPPPSLIGSSKLCSAEMFGLHQDFNLFHPSSSLYLPGRSSLDPYCQSNSLPVSFLHTTHSPYSCQPGPLHPLTMPVKFVVPPSTGGIVSGLGSRLSLEENSAFDRCNENIKQFISAEQSKRVYVDNYSRIVLDENTTTRYNNEHLSNVCTLTLPKRTPTSRNEELGSLNVVDEEINQSSNQLPKFISGGSSKSPFGDHFKEHSSKNLVIRKFPEEEFPSETRNLWKCQKTLIESVQCKNSERKLTEQNETLSITKITTTTPLDLTKLK